jgi:hypothetical protein
MKKRQRTLEVLVNLSLFVGLFVVLWHHRSNDNEGLLILLIGLGVTALINLAVFYWPRFGDPDYDADADDAALTPILGRTIHAEGRTDCF